MLLKKEFGAMLDYGETPLGKHHIREIPKMAPLLELEVSPSFCETCSHPWSPHVELFVLGIICKVTEELPATSLLFLKMGLKPKHVGL
jgi:hypothetical protein